MSQITKYYIQKSFNNKPFRRRLELFNYFSLIIVVTVTLGSVIILNTINAYAAEIPTEENIKEVLSNNGENSRIYDRNGNLLYTFKDPDRDREYVNIEDIPPTVIAALLAAEDKDFFIHEGIDYLGMIKGLSLTLTSNGEVTVGGSTITQQLIKQTLLTNEQTIDRKAKEAMISLFVERDYSKEEIIEYYLNVTNYGGRIVGIRTASKTYFGKDVSELTLEEAIFLVALLQSPGEYSPLFANDPERAELLYKNRMNIIIDQLIENPKIIGYLNTGDESLLSKTAVEYQEYLLQSDQIEDTQKYNIVNINKIRNKEFDFNLPSEDLKAPHWVFYIRDLLNNEPYNLSINELYSGGYNIYTTLDLGVNNLVQRQLTAGVDAYGSSFGFENGAAVLIDSNNGEIISMIGSKGYSLPNDPNNERFDPQVNVTLSDQTLGSSLKPWVYYLAFTTGKYGTESIIKDSPQTFYGNYRPKNYDNRFYGDMTIRKALLDSRNLPPIKLLYQLGDWRLGELMTQIGYNEENNYGLAAAVGGVNENLLDHTGAYTGLANGGEVLKKKAVLKIVDNLGNIYFESEERQVIADLDRPSVAKVNDILGDKSYQPANYRYKFIGAQKLAGKTGTSDANKDTYYMGYSPKFVLGVWVGNNDNSRMSSSALGSSTALPIWNGIARDLVVDYPEYSEFGSY